MVPPESFSTAAAQSSSDFCSGCEAGTPTLVYAKKDTPANNLKEFVAYVKANPTTSITIDGDVSPGFVLDADVDLIDVPDARGFAYVYVDDRPALVDARSRTVIWVE